MDDLFLINFMYDFIVNEMFGSLTLFTIFIVIIIFGLFFFARVPQFALGIFGVALISIFALYNYVIPSWIYVLMLAGVGYTWYQVIKTST